MSKAEKPMREKCCRFALPEQLQVPKKFDSKTIRETIEGLKNAIRENYVFPEKTEDFCESLENHYAKGEYVKITNPEIFCEQLTQHLRDIVNDKHLQVLLPENMPKTRLHVKKIRGEIANPDFGKAEILPGNIGYINVTMFNPLPNSSDEIKGVMQLVRDTSALIIDLRKCRGGSADSLNFLLSYFFNPEASLTLLETYFRPQNQTFQSQTMKTPFYYSKPIYVLISGFTFSGGEHFAFALKIHKRATLVGANTGGGAHPVAFISLDSGLLFKVPIGRTYDPKTNKDWEGIGVAPDIICLEANALNEAQKDIYTKFIAEISDGERKNELLELISALN